MMWWDNETDGDRLYPAEQHNPSQDEEQEKLNRNPEGASLRGLWSERKYKDRVSPDDFLVRVGEPFGEFNRSFKRIAVRRLPRPRLALPRRLQARPAGPRARRRRHGQSRTPTAQQLGRAVAYQDTDNVELKSKPPAGQPVHLKDIHLEKGMHCADCHFRQDSHGTGILYNEPRAAIEISCDDCHGTIRERAEAHHLRLRRRSGHQGRQAG